MSFYGNMQSTAARLLSQFGMTMTLKRNGSTVDWVEGYDSVSGRRFWTKVSDSTVVYVAPSGVPIQYTGKGVVTSFKIGEIDGTNIKVGDKKIVLESVFPEPRTGDKITVGSTDYNVVAPLMVSRPTDTTIVYFVQVRK